MVELIWLTGRLMPDCKTIADFRKHDGEAIRTVCRQFIELCRNMNLFSEAIAAIDGSKFKTVNNQDKNFTERKLKAPQAATRGEHRALPERTGPRGPRTDVGSGGPCVPP
jgi:hypothetical protein